MVVDRGVFVAQLVEWGYDPGVMVVEGIGVDGFHVLSLDRSAVVGGVEYVGTRFVSWADGEHWLFVKNFLGL